MKFPASLCFLALAACSHRAEPPVVIADSKSSGHQESREWTHLSASDTRRVRNPEVIETYFLGRTPSRDRTMMHESHRLYRIAQDASWDLRPKHSPLRSAGHPVAIADDTVRPVPADGIVSAERARQRALTADLAASTDLVEKLAADLREKQRQVGDAVPVVEELKSRLAEETRRRQQLEQDLQKLKMEKMDQ